MNARRYNSGAGEQLTRRAVERTAPLRPADGGVPLFSNYRTKASRMTGRRRESRAFTLTEMLAVMAILSMIVVSLFTIFQQGTETWRLSSARTEAYIKARQILEMMAREIKGAVIITAAGGPRVDPSTGIPKRADFIGMDSAKPENWRTGYQRFSDQLYFVAPVTNAGRQELCMLGYWIKDVENDTLAPLGQNDFPRNSKDDVLQRAYRTDNGGNPDRVWTAFNFTDRSFSSAAFESTWGIVASGIRQLDIKYYDYDTQTGTTPRLTEYPVWDSLPSQYGGSTATKDDDNRLPVAVKITIAVGDANDVIKPIRLLKIVYLDNASTRYAEAVP